MQQGDNQPSAPVPQGRSASLLFLATSVAVAAALVAEFLVGYSVLLDHPDHWPLLGRELRGALAVGLLALVAQGVVVFQALVKPYREAAIKMEHLAQALDQHSHRDALTGALNRTAFEQLIVRELETLRRYGVPLCGIMVDVDGFALVNEARGYEAGDQALVQLAQLIRQHVRRADFVFRWRSGRFLILASGIAEAQAKLLGEKLRSVIAEHRFRQDMRLTACMGVGQARVEDTPDLFMVRVKAALTQAKEQGPGSVA